MENHYSNNKYEPEYEEDFNEDVEEDVEETVEEDVEEEKPKKKVKEYKPVNIQPVNRQVQRQNYDDEMTIGDWLMTFLVLSIPLAGFVMFFVWAFGNGNQTRATFLKAFFILLVILAVLLIMSGLMFGGMLAALM